MKKFIIFSLTILLITSFAFHISASTYPKSEFIYDNAGIFTADEINKLNQKANEMFAQGQGKVEFYITTVKLPYYEGETFCISHGLSTNSNIVLLVINAFSADELYYDIYTYGDAWNKISDTEIDRIIYNDQVYGNLKSNIAFGGAMAYLELTEIAYFRHLAASPLKIVIISTCISTVIAFVVCACVYYSYKKKQKSTNYPLDRFAKLNLTESQDIFLGHHISKTKIQSSSSSSGGRGGSGRGGGGGHRGGA